MMKQELPPILCYEPPKLISRLEELGIHGFKAKEVLKWLFEQREWNPMNWSTLSKDERALIQESFDFQPLQVEAVQESKDGTKKILFQLQDGRYVESVLIPDRKRLTLCISSQVGCPVGCTFCASGLFGLTRNLKTHEILGEYLFASLLVKRPITNLVVMGMGEPFLNFSNVMKALEILNHPEGFRFGIRRMTLSTVGIQKILPRLLEAKLHPRLAISLHAPEDELRKKLIPFPGLCSVQELIDFLEEYLEKRLSRVTLEYVMLGGENTGPKMAHILGKRFSHLPLRVNLIPYNPVSEFSHREPTEQELRRFAMILEGYRLRTTIRHRKGEDIQGACGQLRLKKIQSS
ncbi:MAG: 23S rRNA (adenine(2503)-C(2))-methyltransferase RlmN [Planctomycetota bacterium]|nr:MAG: 23S rRNA (adenine(2503)-C(2))-methyltransferase RlmN [Planctomycetota bacterium]